MSVNANMPYTFYASAGATVNTALFNSPEDSNGSASVQANWFLEVPLGVTYSTQSGYQLPSAPTPEPASLTALGFGAITLARRFRRQ